MSQNINEVENLQAQLKCAQADLFFEIESMIKDTFDSKKLKKIIKQSYYTINYNRFIIEIGGLPKFGVIDNIDFAKRDKIVREVTNQLLKMRESKTWFNLVTLVAAYSKIADWLQKELNAPVLKHRLKFIKGMVGESMDSCMEFKLCMN